MLNVTFVPIAALKRVDSHTKKGDELLLNAERTFARISANGLFKLKTTINGNISANGRF